MERSKMLRGAFSGLAVWFRPKVFRLEHLLDAEDEEVVRRLRAEGHELHWILETRLREFQCDGWKPVTKWDKTGIIAKRLFCCIGFRPPLALQMERFDK
jgi:hypothetical protein